MQHPCPERDRALLKQPTDDRLRNPQLEGIPGIQTLGRGLGDAGEDPADRTPSAVPDDPVKESAHRHQLKAAHMQTDHTDERPRLALLLHDEHPHTMQPQLGGQHRPDRTTPGDDDVEHKRIPHVVR